jgi:hypothetical protein
MRLPSGSGRFKDQPEVEAELLNTLGLVYGDLELPVKGEQMLRKALELRRMSPPDRQNPLRVAELKPRRTSRPQHLFWRRGSEPGGGAL